MKFDDLWDLHEELTKVLARKIAAEKTELEKRLAILNGARFQSADPVLESEANVAMERTRVAPKYRNTSPPHETWSGRGKLPRWLRKALEDGSKIEDFKIR